MGTIIPVYGDDFLTGLEWSPLGVTVSDEGDILVTDVSKGLHRVVIVRTDGALISIIGSEGFDDGQFIYPNLAVEHNGKIYVSDSGNERIQFFESGERSWKFSGAYRNILLEMPLGIAVSFDHLYVVDRQASAVLEFHLGGIALEPTNWLNIEGDNLHGLSSPAGIAVDDQGLIYVADSGNNRVVVWEQT
jgi:DNA-binding beta-propeller fold protein YncE